MLALMVHLECSLCDALCLVQSLAYTHPEWMALHCTIVKPKHLPSAAAGGRTGRLMFP